MSKIVCSRCSAKNAANNLKCHLCDEPLPPQPFTDTSSEIIQLETTDLSRLTISPKKLLLSLSLLVFLLFPVFVINQLLKLPTDALTEKKLFESYYQSYLQDQEYWETRSQELKKILLKNRSETEIGKKSIKITNQPFELLIGYLVDQGIDFEDGLILSPNIKNGHPFITLIMHHKGPWPLQFPITMTISLIHDQHAVVPRVDRCRIGKRDLPSSLCSYFIQDIEPLAKALEEIAGGIHAFHLQLVDEKRDTAPLFSLEYLQYSFDHAI